MIPPEGGAPPPFSAWLAARIEFMESLTEERLNQLDMLNVLANRTGVDWVQHEVNAVRILAAESGEEQLRFKSEVQSLTDAASKVPEIHLHLKQVCISS